MEYLDFEKPIEELIEKLNQAQSLSTDGIETSSTISDLEKKIQQTRKEIYNNLNAWQRVQMSRHPDRPYSMDYINALTKKDFIEIHGDSLKSMEIHRNSSRFIEISLKFIEFQ